MLGMPYISMVTSIIEHHTNTHNHDMDEVTKTVPFSRSNIMIVVTAGKFDPKVNMIHY